MSDREEAQSGKSGDSDMQRASNIKEETDIPGGLGGESSPRSGQREQERPVMRIKEEAAGESVPIDVWNPDPSSLQPGGLFRSPSARSWSSPDSSGEGRSHGGTEDRASRPGSSRIPGKDHRRYYHSHWRLEYLMDFNARSHSMICMVCGSSLATLKLSTIKRHIRQKHPYSLLWTPSEKQVIIGSWDAHLCVDAQTLTGTAGEDSGADDSNTTPGSKRKRRRLPPVNKGAWRPMVGPENAEAVVMHTSYLEQYLNESLQQWFRVEFLMDYDCQVNELHCMMCATVLPSLNLVDIKNHILDTHPISLQFSPSQKSSILEAWTNRGKNQEEEGEDDMEDDDEEEEEEDLVKEEMYKANTVLRLEKDCETHNPEGRRPGEMDKLDEQNPKSRETKRLEEEKLSVRDVEIQEAESQKVRQVKRLEEEKPKMKEARKLEEEKLKEIEAQRLEEEKQKLIEAERVEVERLKRVEEERIQLAEEKKKMEEKWKLEEEKRKAEQIQKQEEESAKRAIESHKVEEKQKELEKQQKMQEIQKALEKQEKILEAEKLRNMQVQQMDVRGQTVLNIGLPMIKVENPTPILITLQPSALSSCSPETLTSWRIIAPKNTAQPDPKTPKPAVLTPIPEAGQWPSGVDPMLWEVSVWRRDNVPFNQGNTYQMKWRNEYLMDYNGLRGSVVCMYCCSSLTVLKVSSIKRHIIQKHPQTAQLTTEEKAAIVEEWEKKVTELKNMFVKPKKKKKGGLVKIAPCPSFSLCPSAEVPINIQFLGGGEQKEEKMEDPQPNWISAATPDPKGASWEFAFGRVQAKGMDSRKYQHDRWKLEYLMDYTANKDGLICMVCGVILLNPKISTVKMHIQQKHPDTTYLSDQEKAVVMEEWEQKMSGGHKGATQQEGGEETEICIEINEESTTSDTNGSNSGNCSPNVSTTPSSSSKPAATMSIDSLPPPCNSAKRNYQVRWRTEFMMDYDCRRQGLICMVCGGTLATLKVSTIKRHIVQVHPYSVDFTVEERQRILAAYSEMAAHYIHSEECFKLREPMFDEKGRKRKLPEEA
ncbi:zinc finger translocation-associated protein [Discoglossus pictus]